MAAIDGSPASYHALRHALSLGRALGLPVEAVAAYDPRFHRHAFHSIATVLSAEAARLFRFNQQQVLHEEIIDQGLERVYTGYLRAAGDMASQAGMELVTTLLTGKPWEQVLHYVRETPTFLLVVSRFGQHRAPYSQIGSTAENLVRTAPCPVLVVNPPRASPQAAPAGA